MTDTKLTKMQDTDDNANDSTDQKAPEPKRFQWDLLVEGPWSIFGICRIWRVEDGLHALSVDREVIDSGELEIVGDSRAADALESIIDSDSTSSEVPKGDLGEWWAEIDKIGGPVLRDGYRYKVDLWIHGLDSGYRNNELVGIRFD